MANDQQMMDIALEEHVITLRNPFGKKDFLVKVPSARQQDNFVWEVKALAAVSGLPSKFSNKELADEVKAGLCGIENCINELLAVILGEHQSQSFCDKVWQHVPDLLFPRHDWAELTRRLMPLMINHFTSIRCMNVVEANTCRRDPLEQGDFFDHILSKRSGKLEKRRSTASAMLETITYMIEGRFQLNDLITAVIHATYVKVGKAYIEHLLERSGGLTIEQMDEIYEVLWAWLSTIPLTDRDDLRTVQDLGRNVLRKAIIDPVDTPAILNGYSLCVESLRELDPSCVIMHRVCKVIKEYLK
ncbi:unnamed protein product [Heligmosomoides polygyrus]|uniref:DUF577 domain-containing protein n=1 Tax=Heligmosomoides polygyrus TaxID=6339 RepID=A0A183F6M9_HELPZ|nr:unnamed protein product [Heligmosomoides polygyrus]